MVWPERTRRKWYIKPGTKNPAAETTPNIVTANRGQIAIKPAVRNIAAAGM